MTRNNFENYNSPFASRFRELMENTQTTQEDIAQLIGKTRQAVSHYMNGNSDPNLETLITLAKYFSVTTDFLLGITDDPSTHPSAVNDLHLSPKAIDKIKLIAKNASALEILNNFLESNDFQGIIARIGELKKAVKEELAYLDTSKKEGKNTEKLLHNEEQEIKTLAYELEKKFPQFKNRLYISSGNNAIVTCKDDILTDMDCLICESISYQKLADLLRNINTEERNIRV